MIAPIASARLGELPTAFFPKSNTTSEIESMWCTSCRADVAAELSTDNRRMMCARCHTDIGIAAGASLQIASVPKTTEAERDARELLARWSAQNVLEPVSALKPIPKSLGQGEHPQLPPSDLRFDTPKSLVPSPSPQFLTSVREQPVPVLSMSSSVAHTTSTAVPNTPPTQTPVNSVTTPAPTAANPTPKSDQHHLYEPDQRPAANHDHLVREAIHQTGHRRAPWFTLAGQLCAFAGVGLLTCGTVLVMWSYFGGPGRYMPTGWLIAAVGQMLLFLGVIALISSGLDQTSYEVGWRIDHLAEEVHSMSLALEQLERRMKNESASKSDSTSSAIQDAA